MPPKKTETLKEYGRGIMGGLIFSLPLIYTMELWWTGFIASPEKLLGFVGFTFLLLLGYNRYSGIREEDTTFYRITRESIEELCLAVMVTFLFLLVLDRISFLMSIDEIIGKVIVESMIVAIGISVGKAQLGQNNNGNDNKQEKKDKDSGLLSMIILSVCGAVLFASSVAPTEEILMIAVGSESIDLLGLILISIILCTIILFFSDFRKTGKVDLRVREMILHIVISYCAALIVSLILLWFFGRIGENGFNIVLSQVIVLSIPGTIGASAGRLLIK